MMWGYDGLGLGLGWAWMAGTMVLFWGGVIILAIWGIRALSAPRQVGDQALETLRRRLAAGEISQEDFENTKRILRG